MKRWLPFALIFTLAAGALIYSERRALHIAIGPHALIAWLGDGEREATRIPTRMVRLSDADEIALGDRLSQHYSAPLSPDDRAMQSYIDLVGLRLSLHGTRKLPYHFHYIADRSFENAFALPGGHVFIGAGLITHMESEDELASVLAHEVEHIDRRHCAERAQVEAAAHHLGIVGALAALPVELFMAGYSKQQELEADLEGVRLAVLSGYSPYGARDVMQRFAKLHAEGDATHTAGNPVGEVARVPLQSLKEYFRTHPPADERIAAIDTLIAREHWQTRRTQKPLKLRVTPQPTLAEK